MTHRFLIVASLLSVALAQTTVPQKISLDPSAGPLKLRIVFQSDQSQAQQTPCSTGNCQATPTLSPCASGNCGAVQQAQQAAPCSTGNCGQQTVQQSPCATGNCNGLVAGNNNIVPAYDYTTTTPTPVTIRTVPIASNSPPIKVIRVPSYSSSGCSGSSCGGPRIVYAQSPCSGNSCGSPRIFFPPRRQFFAPPPRPIFISRRNNNNGGNIAVPDAIYRDGMVIRAPIRVPSSYQDGNPVFDSGK